MFDGSQLVYFFLFMQIGLPNTGKTTIFKAIKKYSTIPVTTTDYEAYMRFCSPDSDFVCRI